MPRDELADQVRPLQHDAAACGPRRRLAEVLEERRARHGLVDALPIMDGLGRELDDRARLDVPVRTDVVAHAGRHGAQRLPLVVPVGVDDGDGQLRAHADDEAAHAEHLLGRQRDLGRRLRADDAVGVEPGIVHAEVDEPPQPRLLHEVVDVGLAHARGHAGDQPVAGAGLEPGQRLVEHVGLGRGVRRSPRRCPRC